MSDRCGVNFSKHIFNQNMINNTDGYEPIESQRRES